MNTPNEFEPNNYKGWRSYDGINWRPPTRWERVTDIVYPIIRPIVWPFYVLWFYLSKK